MTNETSDLNRRAMDMLLATSRTFYIPIIQLTPELKEAVASAYLCMRAIDEIEDHTELSSETKVYLLEAISNIPYSNSIDKNLQELFKSHSDLLPEVTLCMGDWLELCPQTIAPTVWNATTTMAQGMAEWVAKEWKIVDREDLNEYTFYVAGLVGVLLSDIWKWHADIETDRNLAIAFGRGLQAVNIIRNRSEDMSRGVDFFPEGWEMGEMFIYARSNLEMGETYSNGIESGPIRNFCTIPLALAKGTLDAMESGEAKLTRADVNTIVHRVIQTSG